MRLIVIILCLLLAACNDKGDDKTANETVDACMKRCVPGTAGYNLCETNCAGKAFNKEPEPAPSPPQEPTPPPPHD